MTKIVHLRCCPSSKSTIVPRQISAGDLQTGPCTIFSYSWDYSREMAPTELSGAQMSFTEASNWPLVQPSPLDHGPTCCLIWDGIGDMNPPHLDVITCLITQVLSWNGGEVCSELPKLMAYLWPACSEAKSPTADVELLNVMGSFWPIVLKKSKIFGTCISDKNDLFPSF